MLFNLALVTITHLWQMHKLTKFTSLTKVITIYVSQRSKRGSRLRTGMVSTVATFGACRCPRCYIWYIATFPHLVHLLHLVVATTMAVVSGIGIRGRREGVTHIIRGISHRTHTWQNQNFCLILTAFEGFEGAGQEADLKEQENLAKCNDSETVGTAVSHEKASTAFNLFSWKKLSKGYRLINFNTSENAFKTYQTYQMNCFE